LLLSGHFAESPAQTAVTLEPVKDNTVFESPSSDPRSSGAGSYLFSGQTAGGEALRALVAFDVASAVPPGATVSLVELTLDVDKIPRDSRPETFSLHRVLQDWGEGTSSSGGGQGAVATDGDATWDHTFFPSGFWSARGGDFTASASAAIVADDVGSYTWGSTDMLVADVQAWLDTPEENFGWILIGNEISSQSARRFRSREAGDEAVRPKLRIEYESTVGIEETGELPSIVRVGSTYPNPFRQQTSIEFELSESSPVAIEVFDALGRRVESLGGGVYPAGRHTARFEANSRPAGVYFFRLGVGESVIYRQIVLLR
jgi:hypothetical protein